MHTAVSKSSSKTYSCVVCRQHNTDIEGLNCVEGTRENTENRAGPGLEPRVAPFIKEVGDESFMETENIHLDRI